MQRADDQLADQHVLRAKAEAEKLDAMLQYMAEKQTEEDELRNLLQTYYKAAEGLKTASQGLIPLTAERGALE